ncbi:MAG: tRNA guanosine(34) transglycosylase Tgt [Oscillospiraceae bacterium]|nr:tRNA guanosine(34) transglycosylase Tgt [Oscillospiraceae bacterium]
MYKLITSDSKARRGVLATAHGEIQTPFFMNVATAAAIKGGISAPELSDLKCQVMLCNTYHLHIRPGDDVIRDLGGLHAFTNWNKPILTDSGGFQVFSLGRAGGTESSGYVGKPPIIKESGVFFSSHIDGKKIFMGPEESMRIQYNLGADIVMAFDECIPDGQSRVYVENSVKRTTRWLIRCQEEMLRLESAALLFGINQGGVYNDIRVKHMQEIAELNLPGYAIGGLAVGEAKDDMFRVIEAVEPYMPTEKPRYLMGVGTPSDIIEAVFRGIDMFDCVMPTRNARHGTIFTSEGILHIKNKRYERDDKPLDEVCGCPVCAQHSRGYIRHLFKAQEYLAGRLSSIHNLYFYNALMEKIRTEIENSTFTAFREENSLKLSELIR